MSRSGLYKRYPCRHFDDNGRALDPSCIQGDRCRFLHPDDADWEKAIRKTSERNLCNRSDRNTRNNRKDTRHERRTDDGLDVESNASRRSDPLMPQADLFLRYKVDKEEDVGRRNSADRIQSQEKESGSENSSTRTGQMAKCPKTEALDDVSPHPQAGNHKDTHSGRDVTFNGGKGVRDKGAIKRGINRADPVPRRREQGGLDKQTLSESDQAPKGEVDIFLEISKLANEAMQDAALQVTAEKKLCAYTDLSASISKVSSSASRMMAPALAEVFLRHTESKRRAEQSNKALSDAWAKAMGQFRRDIQRTVDNALQKALQQLDAKAQSCQQETSRKSPSLKRTRAEMQSDKNHATESKQEGVYGRAEYNECAPKEAEMKRRRVGCWEEQPAKSDGTRDNDSSLGDMLDQLRWQLDDQERRMQALRQENNELRNAFTHERERRQPSLPPVRSTPDRYQSHKATQDPPRQSVQQRCEFDRPGSECCKEVETAVLFG